MIESIQSEWCKNIKIPWEHKIMVKEVRLARYSTISNYVIIFGYFMSKIFLPLIDLNNGLMFPSVNYSNLFFVLIYANHLISVIFVGISMCVADHFLGVLIFYACTRYEILKRKMNKFPEKKIAAAINSGYFKSKLKEIVDLHVSLIR